MDETQQTESAQTSLQKPSSSEWTEEDTAKMRNGARVLARIILSASAFLLSFLATAMIFNSKDARRVAFVFAFVAVYLQVISWYVLTPGFKPSAWLRIPVKITFWVSGIALFFIGLILFLDSGWKWENVLLFSGGVLLISVAKLLYEKEKGLNWFRNLRCGCMALAILLTLGIHYSDAPWVVATWGFTKKALIWSGIGMFLIAVLFAMANSDGNENSEENERKERTDENTRENRQHLLNEAKPKDTPRTPSERHFCKYCGKVASSSGSLNGTCFRNRGRNHFRYRGGERSRYRCKYCGLISSTIDALTSGRCYKSPEGENHVPYSGTEKSRYECEYCRQTSSTIDALTSGRCFENPNGKNHVPYED